MPAKVLEDRQHWGRRLEFLLAIIGYSVGVGNIWRFPYTCYDSGGGAFLIAYLIMWTLCGVPLLYMELAIGQYTRRGPIGAMSKMCPLFKGAGVGSVVKIGINRTLYMVLLVWPFYYLFTSFKAELPWSHCRHEWNSPNCVEGNGTIIKNGSEFGNATPVSSFRYNDTISPSADYFRNYVLQLSSGIGTMGSVRWEFALILLLAWLLMYFAIFKGTKSVGKVVYVTVLFPYIVLIVLIVRGFTLPGSYEGMVFFFKPKWHRLTEAKVWVHAAATNFFSLGISGGGNITLASFNKHHGKIFRFTIIIASVDLLTSIMAGIAIFSNLGYLAQHQGKEVDDVVNSGTELAFIVFPEIFTTMPISQLFSTLFFLMIITLAIDTMLVGPEIIVTAITDKFKSLPRREVLHAIVAVFLFFLGFPSITQGGLYYFALLDFYGSFVSSVSLAFFEIIAVAWLYGAKNLAKNILEMTGSAPHMLLILCWYIVSPLIIIAIWVFSIIKYQPYTMGSYVYPAWAVGIAWGVSSIPLVCVPIGMVDSVYKAKGTSFFEKLRCAIKQKPGLEINTKDREEEMKQFV